MRGRLTGDEWWRPMPPGASADALRVLAARGVRAFGDGFVALLLPIYLVERGFSALAIGAIVTGTLIGTALTTLWVGWIANRRSRRLLLLAASLLMATTGAGFAVITGFWPLLVIAFVGWPYQSRPRPPRAAPATSTHIGLNRVARVIAAAAIVTAAGRHPVSAARAITAPLAMTIPMVTGIALPGRIS